VIVDFFKDETAMKFRKFRSATVKNTTLALCLLLGAFIAGCDGSNNVSVEDHLKKAQELLDKADFRGSVIELKNVLQKEPGNATARLILSQVYAEVGDGASAEKEILQAQKLGLKGLDATKALGHAYILTNKFKQVLEEFKVEDNDPASRKASIYLLHGDAYYGMGKNVDAVSAYDNAIKAYRKDINEDRPHLKLTEPAEFVEAMVGKTMVSIRRQNWPAAKQRLDEVLKVAPEDPEALAAKGEITFKQQDAAASEEAYLAAFKAKPFNLEFQIGVARAQISLKKIDEAIVNLEAVRKHFPDHVVTNQYRALAALHSKDYETAKRFADSILKNLPEYIPAHLIAGAANYGLGNFEQANVFLSRYLATAPGDTHARALLGVTQLQLHRPKDALETFQPLSKDRPDDSVALNLIATAAVQSGDLTTASAYLQKAVAVKPNDSEARRKLAIIKIAKGDRAGGLKDLQDSIERTPTFLRNQYTLMEIYLREMEYDKVIEVARALQTADPKNPAPHIGEGLAWTGKRVWSDAISAFENALKIQPGHIGAAYGLVEIHLQTNKPDNVRQIYTELLEKNPGHLRTLMRWIGLETKLGDAKMTRSLIARAIKTNPEAVAPRVLAAQAQVDANQPIKAIATLSDVSREHPDNTALLKVMGRARIKAQKYGEAAVTLERLVRLAPNSPSAHYLLAQAFSLLGNQGGAITELGIVLALDPKFLRARIARIRAMMVDNRTNQAFAALRTLKSDFPDNPDVLFLEGWIATRLGKFDKAISILKIKLANYPTEDTAVQLAAALWNGGKKDTAEKTLKTWISNHKKDVSARLELANYYTIAGRPKDAINVWRTIIEHVPTQWVALNNLASVLTKTNSKEALAFSERAYKAAPNILPVAMTLVELLLLSNEPGRAIEILGPLATKHPKQHTAQLLLAKAHAKSGNNAVAKKILEKISTRNPDGDIRQKMDALLKELGK
jgi:cellulose synthase operon protein C